MELKQNVLNNLDAVRSNSPLVHNITNYVVMNNTANALLAIGASPVMAHSSDEVADMVAIASSLVINIGTLSRDWVKAMSIAMKAAAKKGIPIVFDPVGAGATPYRSQTVKDLVTETAPTIIRGNASEIMSMVDSTVKTKGVDSSSGSDEAIDFAKELASHLKCVVVVSGANDIICDGERTLTVKNGHPMMSKVTGMGCTATSIIGAFAAVEKDPLIGAFSAMTAMGVCGEMSAEKAEGPGSFQMHFIDALHNVDRDRFESSMRFEQ